MLPILLCLAYCCLKGHPLELVRNAALATRTTKTAVTLRAPGAVY